MLNKKLLVAIALAVLALFLVVGCGGGGGGEATQPQEPEQPAVEDSQPAEEEQAAEEPQEEEASASGDLVFVSSEDKAGCADCHGEVANTVANIEGHPQIPMETLADCQPCHAAEGDISLSRVLHDSHYAADDSFACVHCHKLAEDGTVPVGELAPEGTGFVTIEVASVDNAPDGCLDCHKSDDEENSLTAVIAKIDGHPQMPMETAADCVQCHAEGSPLALSGAMHKAHLQGEAYKESFGNSCLNCHELENRMAAKGL